ncbi:hypothetical protein PILCRDRAFT_829235 [Piloderma croceum F 1598]|uniref:Uncharacterized protein n=1 Tax=Piloderma croceum (strain F 1598) TaxID=765440 RepID=A0A0C3B7K0_PILCF|nr:hypothetical protein PILCRDRAFT_829235 [Piloderma croceum F 1598]
MFSWLSSFMISQEKESWAREQVMRENVYLNAITAERDDVYRMLEASGFLDPELSRDHIGLACSVAAVSTIRDLVFLSIWQLMLSYIDRENDRDTLEVLACRRTGNVQEATCEG